MQTLIEGRADFGRSTSKVLLWMSAQKCAHNKRDLGYAWKRIVQYNGLKNQPVESIFEEKSCKNIHNFGQEYDAPWMSA